MKLIIVESPTKAKTITKFLDSNYKIESCFGHVRDLPKSEMGIDIENNFQPKYIIPDKARKTVSNLKTIAKKATQIILASDEDREGEAIAWHLVHALGLNSKSEIKRIVFHEITKTAILDALKNPRDINIKMVNAQQARRILDRLVGYELSPFLWKKVARGLSAGRVQSVAVRLVVEREREIQKFKTKEYWSITALLQNVYPVKSFTENKKKSLILFNRVYPVKSCEAEILSKTKVFNRAECRMQNVEIEAKLNKINGKSIGKFEIKNKEHADEILNKLKNAQYVVSNIEQKQSKKNPPTPFITSTLQQTANRWLGFSAKQTMMIAQQLYENGFITYMRTDSLNLSNQFLIDAQKYLKENLGKEYCLQNPRIFKTKNKNSQEAHEAIRPTETNRIPELIKDNNQHRLYKLIWQRALASQMPEAIVSATTIDVDATQGKTPSVLLDTRCLNPSYQFRATGQVIKFDGYLKIYPEKSKELELPNVEKNEKLDLKKIQPEQHFTKPPARYSDAGLIKEMEKYGIGRPSTYAPTISTIIARNYVDRDENKKLYPTEIAFVVIDLLIKHFQHIVDYKFTAKMEDNLDDISNGTAEWQVIVKNFYNAFHSNLEIKYKEVNKKEIMPEEKTKEICDKCKAPMIIKTGRFGKFLACSAFPKCKNIKGLENKKSNNKEDEKFKELQEKYKNEKCEKCEAKMIIRKGKFGPFLGCSSYPKCKNLKNIKENNNSTGIKCPICNKGEIVQKRSKRGIFYACDQYPDCKTAFWSKPTGEKCPECESLLIENKDGGIKCSNRGCGYSK